MEREMKVVNFAHIANTAAPSMGHKANSGNRTRKAKSKPSVHNRIGQNHFELPLTSTTQNEKGNLPFTLFGIFFILLISTWSRIARFHAYLTSSGVFSDVNGRM